MKQSEIGQALDKLQNEYSFETQIISILNGSNLKYRGHIGLAKFTKDIAIGYAQWLVDNYSVDFEGFRFPVFINHTEYTNEQLLNKYLENLK